MTHGLLRGSEFLKMNNRHTTGDNMITNERQYKITKVQTDKFKQALDLHRKEGSTGNENARLLYEMQEEALKSQIGDLEAELKEYELLRKNVS